MKHFWVIALALGLMAMVLCSCVSTSMSVSVSVPEKGALKPERLAVVMVAFEPVERPTFPLIDAAFIRGYVNDLGPAIVELSSVRVDEYREQIADSLRQLFRCDVLYGSSLHSLPGYTACTERYDRDTMLATGDEAFPYVQCGTGDVNFFPIEGGDLSVTFAYPDNYGLAAGDVCRTLEVDGIVVIHSRIRVMQPDVILSTASVNLYTNFYIFGPHGETLAKGEMRSSAERLNPSVISTYSRAISRFPHNWATIVAKLKEELE